MRALLALALLSGCATGPHADTYVKKNFGFAGPREITVVGPSDDTNSLRLQLQKHGFDVLEVDGLDKVGTKYAAEIAGVCNMPIIGAQDAELHVFVVKAETRERLLSVRLANRDDCPGAFFVEAAAAIARNWPNDPQAVK